MHSVRGELVHDKSARRPRNQLKDTSFPRRSAERGVYPRPPEAHERRQQLLAKFALREKLRQPEQTREISFGNPELPAYKKKQEVMDIVKDNQVVILSGPTGSGKSTQVPQFLLEAGFENIVVTQPRILAANGVAFRIQDELEGVFGEPEARNLVSVHTAEQDSRNEHTRITVVTDGLRLVQQLDASSNTFENEVLIVDEVHEWNENIEIIVALVKKLVAEKPQLRVIIMSATMASQELSDYFMEATGVQPPIVEIEGMTHEVERREEPSSTIVKEVVKASETAKTILVFVPGKREIYDTIDDIAKNLPADIAKTATLLPLHAKMTSNEQNRVYNNYGGLKIIVATNVAQTSITIPGVDYVIDCGEERRVELDEEATEGLVRRACSQDDCDQRAGRTGRDTPGIYILTRYDDESRFISYGSREKHAPAAILSADLSRSVLRTTVAGIDFAALDLFHAVSPTAVHEAKEKLYSLQAIDDLGDVTDIGARMNIFPINTSYGRMMAEATKPGMSQEVAVYMAAITACFEAGGLRCFTNGEDRWRKLKIDAKDDPLYELSLFRFAGVRSNTEDDDTRLIEHGFEPKNVSRARRTYRKICRKLNINPYEYELQPPSGDLKEQIHECVLTGYVEQIYERSGRNEKRQPTYTALSLDTLPRIKSSRSALEGSPDYMAGVPRYYLRQNGDTTKVDIIENATSTNQEQISQVAGHLATTVLGGYSIEDGALHVRHKKSVHGIQVGEERTLARYTEANADKLVTYILEHPGDAQRKLRQIKTQLEELQRLTTEPLPMLTHNDIVALVTEAVKTTRSVFVYEIDEYLQTQIEKKDISIDQYVSEQKRLEIIRSAVPEISVGGITLHLHYQHGTPIAQKTSNEYRALLPDHLTIPDGREIMIQGPKIRVFEEEVITDHGVVMKRVERLGQHGYELMSIGEYKRRILELER